MQKKTKKNFYAQDEQIIKKNVLFQQFAVIQTALLLFPVLS